MKIEQIYTGCLAHGAYYIQSGSEIAIIDPLRETKPYTLRALGNEGKIKYIFETHFHADFVSGHVDLAKQTGATVVFGPTAQPAFDAHVGYDGEKFQVGEVTFTLLHTPGHTMESACYLLTDKNGKDIALFSGDTLFIGDVGRPDLAQKFAGKTQDELAKILFHSLRDKIMPLGDDIVVYPGHGAGSACGKNMSKETSDTLGHQKSQNYALRADMTEEEFVKEVTTGLMPPPAYFPINVMMNKTGYESIDKVVKKGSRAFSAEEFEALANSTKALLLDTRKASVFAEGFIPNSVNIGIDGSFAPWVGALIQDTKQPILLITEFGREEEAVYRLARVGYDNAIGYLEGGIKAWVDAGKELDTVQTISAEDFFAVKKAANDNLDILDIRKKNEYDAEHIRVAKNLPLDYINQTMDQVDKNKTYYVHCAGGYRSMIFVSILKARGYHNLIDVKGGMGAIKETNLFSLTDYVKPVSML
ncbi:Glyoxylase, beta-lactamase superfamily II [Filimonas lacunae]|uniref:Glyoxylase, beta-lactamase superfamily II n=1 Tax=Filimonas lacunae TaxID=477680 RepID=A0A173MQZ0_9BACT|nr:MBL fold metallo-hydrolase [Filimonas lacunae]BAV09801.1 metallo-beta-lactamase family protein [Filimonas lacunae]SIS79143.1 Glyoxylase, beta-lactamase superfamily II [Filimonas lacunae]